MSAEQGLADARSSRRSKRISTALLITFLISSAGDEVALIGVVWHLARDGNGWLVSLALGVQLAPAVLLAPVSGLLIDRFDTGTVLRIGTAAQAVVVALMAAFPNTVMLLLGLLLIAVVQAVVSPSIYALLPVIASSVSAGRANALLELSRSAAALGGPLLGGVLVASAGTRAALIVDSISFGVATVVLLVVRVSRGRREPAPGRWWVGAARGFRELHQNAHLRALVPMLVVSVTVSSMVNVAIVFFAMGPLSGSATALGVLSAAWGAGAIGAAAMVARLPLGKPEMAVFGGTALMGFGIGAWGLTSSVFAAALFAALAGAGSTAANIGLRATVQTRSHPQLLGRVHAAVGAVMNSLFLVGYAVAGAVASGHPAATFVWAGGLTLVAALLAAVRAYGIWKWNPSPPITPSSSVEAK